MNRVIRVIALLLCLFASGPILALDLEPIPAGADLVLFVNNHSALPLGSLLDAAPLPPPVREKVNEFFAATGFNPLKDITRMQIMVKKGATKPEDHAGIVLTGSFNKDKILGFITSKIGQGVEEEKVGDQTLLKSKDGKGGLCFLDASHVVLGTLPAVRTFIEAKAGTNLSQDFESLKSLVSDKAYVALMIGGKEFLQKEMGKNRERRKERLERLHRGPNQIGNWLETYFSEGVEPQGVFAQILDSKAEVKLFYARGESKGNTIQGSVEINDPKLTIETLYKEFLKVVPTMTPPAPRERGEGKPEGAPPAKSGW